MSEVWLERIHGLLEAAGGDNSHDPSNSTRAALDNGQSYTGDWVLNTHSDVMVVCKTDTTGTLSMDFSPDGVNQDSSLSFEVAANFNEIHTLVKGPRYYRTRFTNNSGSNQTFLRMFTYYGSFKKLTSPLNGTIATDADALITRSISEEIPISQGRFSGYAIVNKFGRNDDIDTGSVPEDLWEGGGVYTGFPVQASAETVEVWSSSTNDRDGGSGAHKVTVFGLDGDWAIASETLTLQGASTVATSTEFRRVNRAIVVSAGASGHNAGTLTCRHTTTTANVFFKVPPESNRTQVACYTIPAGKTGYLKSLHATLRKGGGAQFDRDADAALVARPDGGVFQVIRPFGISNGGGFQQNYFGGLVLTEKTDVAIRVDQVSHDNSGMAGGFDILLVND